MTFEHDTRLRDKLREEVEELLASDNDDPEELAVILEVIYALAEQAGIGPQELVKLRAAKAAEQGAFSARNIWIGNHPSSLQREGAFR